MAPRPDANHATDVWQGLIHDADGNPARTLEVARRVLHLTPEADNAFDPAPIDAEFGLWMIAVTPDVNKAWWDDMTQGRGFEFHYTNRAGDVYVEADSV